LIFIASLDTTGEVLDIQTSRRKQKDKKTEKKGRLFDRSKDPIKKWLIKQLLNKILTSTCLISFQSVRFQITATSNDEQKGEIAWLVFHKKCFT